ncbi:hypothetical protein RU97_GL000062 [Enterococcus canis]|uniref:Hemolysin n=1 Tax=Enterococcus canis TaxID=214095 RepID=A0A1L8RJ86_9ENTE|nr:hemolysin family protein [Enterococcus canis]OJG19829.1 hypothetical protein RU97_GL000062 [Enterococcus canis]
MDPQSSYLIGILIVLLILSAFFSSSETAFSSANRIRLKSYAQLGKQSAQTALDLLEDYDHLLSTILIGNNIVNIAASSIATLLFVAHFGNLGVTLSTVVMTLLVLSFGEITPKTLAKEDPEAFAMRFAWLLKVLNTLFTPLNALFSVWKKLLQRFMPATERSTITEEELLSLVEEAAQEGSIDEEDEVLIKNVVEFNDTEVGAIYTPRVDVISINAKMDCQEITDLFIQTGFSRLPFYQTNIDEIEGIIHQKDFHNDVITGKKSIEEIVKPVAFVPKSIKISELLKNLQREKLHLAVVVDEHGGTLGIATMEDIIEELVGEIWDEYDQEDLELIKLSDYEYRIKGQKDLDDLEDILMLADRLGATTVGGYIMNSLGKIPEVGDELKIGSYELSVIEMDQHRIEEVRLLIQPESQPQ